MNMQNLLKQAQKMQKELAIVEEELKEKEYQSELSGGIITATVTGGMRLKDISIDKSLLMASNQDELQDMIITVVNNALSEAEKNKEEILKKITGGVKMPGGF